MKLLIVESPGKLKTLRKILGRDWLIEASVGHTTELASDGPKRWGFEFKDGHVLTHYTPRGDRGRAVLSKLKAALAKADELVLATDPDREGEAIAWHLVQQLKPKKFYRVAYTQITETAVKQALAHPLSLNMALIESQRARQCLDKLVGYEVSPLLWSSTGGKSAGRVQSATLHLICERERERLAFKPEDYWTLKSKYKEGFEAIYEPSATAEAEPRVDPKADSKDKEEESARQRLRTEAEASRIAEIARANPHIVESYEDKIEMRRAPPPLITSSLQQVAGAKFRFSPKHTMKIAQELYEGVVGQGLITYMRTDAVALSLEFIAEARAWLAENAAEALPDQAQVYRVKADAQGAHEAIRPTSAHLTPEKARGTLSADQYKLYSLIWERAIASQCKPAKLGKAKIKIKAAETSWVARGTTVLEPGYLRFWKNLETEIELPVVAAQTVLGFEDVAIAKHTTTPPPRYSEPRLVQLMERKGIGRPSTYASTIATLKERSYVTLESAVLAPTALGLSTDEALAVALPKLVDTKFTADMEADLDRIAEGSLPWERYLTQWNKDYFEPAVGKARGVLAARPRTTSLETVDSSPKASSRSSAPSSQGPHAERLQKALSSASKNGAVPVCPKGHGPMSVKLSKQDKFYWKCPFPECDSFAWYQHFSSEKCPVCGHRLEKIPSKKVTGGYFLKCSRKKDHVEDVLLFKDKKTKEWVQIKKSVRQASP